MIFTFRMLKKVYYLVGNKMDLVSKDKIHQVKENLKTKLIN